jgi:agmatine deiminase
MAEFTRRAFMHGAAVLALTPRSRASSEPSWQVPADDHRHVRTWMAWPHSTRIWGSKLPGIQSDIARLAAAIAEHEPVVMCANSERSAAAAQRACGSSVEVIDTIPVDDCWMRDTGPIFRLDRGDRRDAIGLNFNGWGAKQRHGRDRHVAARVAGRNGDAFTAGGVVGEGGGIETDGAGTLIATTSCWVNRNRNPGRTRDEIQTELLALYGATKMIWLPGVRGRDITDGHVDPTVRFVRPGVVMVQLAPPDRNDIWARTARRQLQVLRRSTDAADRRLEILVIEGPDQLPRWPSHRYHTFLDSYVNWVHTNHAIITVEFGDERKDQDARTAIAEAFNREVIQLRLDHLHGDGGGGAHCVTAHEPQ